MVVVAGAEGLLHLAVVVVVIVVAVFFFLRSIECEASSDHQSVRHTCGLLLILCNCLLIKIRYR